MAALIPSVFMATLLTDFFNKGFDLLPLQLYRPFSVFAVMPLSSQLVLCFPAPGWLSPTCCEGADTKSLESETLWWSFPDEEKEGRCRAVLCSACGPDCTEPCAASRVLVSLVPGRLMTCPGLASWPCCLKSRLLCYSLFDLGGCTRWCGKLRLHRKHVVALGTELGSPESPPGPLTTKPLSLTNWIQREQSFLRYLHAGRAEAALWESNTAKQN